MRTALARHDVGEVYRLLGTAGVSQRRIAAWIAHDLGLGGEARRYLTQAVQTTQQAEDPLHSAIVLYHLGRVPLDNGNPAEALKLFQLGQIAAQGSHSSAAVALLLANEALSYAHLADPRQALTSLRRAEDEYAPRQPRRLARVPGVLRPRGAGDQRRPRAQHLGITDAAHRPDAIARLHHALAEAPADRARQRAFNLIWLATCTLADGDLDDGTRIGNQALDAVRGLNSRRLLDYLAPPSHRSREPRRSRRYSSTRARRAPVARSLRKPAW
jgi:tetratricopeptide (TPR) repeat protein